MILGVKLHRSQRDLGVQLYHFLVFVIILPIITCSATNCKQTVKTDCEKRLLPFSSITYRNDIIKEISLEDHRDTGVPKKLNQDNFLPNKEIHLVPLLIPSLVSSINKIQMNMSRVKRDE